MAESYSNGRKLFKPVQNTVGKGEIACYEQFLLFQQCFQKACFPGASKSVIVWEWVKVIVSKIDTDIQLSPCPIIIIADDHYLTLYYIIPTFNNPEKERFSKHCGEKEKMLVTSIFSFSFNVFYSFKNKVQFLSHNYFVICKVFHFGMVKVFSFG